MEELPSKLRVEMALVIHHSMYQSVEFLSDKERSFIIWISGVIRQIHIDESEYIYVEGEEIIEMYFFVKGQAGFVLPRYDNKVFFELKPGSFFGHLELAESYGSHLLEQGDEIKTRYRRFTAQALDSCDLLALSLDDLANMKLDFPDAYKEIFKNAQEDIQELMLINIEVVRRYEMIKAKDKLGGSEKMKSTISAKMLGGLQSQLLKSMHEGVSQNQTVPKAPIVRFESKSSLYKGTSGKDEDEILSVSSQNLLDLEVELIRRKTVKIEELLLMKNHLRPSMNPLQRLSHVPRRTLPLQDDQMVYEVSEEEQSDCTSSECENDPFAGMSEEEVSGFIQKLAQEAEGLKERVDEICRKRGIQ
ncbi:hypothetical protein FGO68_gene4315 [Halteria grandinella]|uniref:Cyclic nucleotide-binding domain-containing protein n=1 Tax=Halteria grandinella TaxID=5974 RepID=A0A8J8P0U9_HALGN|nr:hypothetical protein FGO68_gene4315 [Halteria grandinella]